CTRAANEDTTGNKHNNDCDALTFFIAPADLGITKTATTDSSPQTGAVARPGDRITYTITVTNNGPNPATGTVTMTDDVPSGTNFLTYTAPAGWLCATPSLGSPGSGLGGLDVKCLKNFIDQGAGFTGTAVFTVVVLVLSSTSGGLTLDNCAGTNSDASVDPNLGNNVACKSIPVALVIAD